MRRLGAFVAIAFACCFASAPAHAGKRVALVIGNSAYQNVAALPNPANDAAAVADMLKKASFDLVTARQDLRSQDMRRALREFTDQARGADIAVIYFAGHGLEVNGSNYVVPIDAMLERDADVEDEAVSLNRLLFAAEPASKLRLVILDACRDNPFDKKMKRMVATRAVSRGLIGVEANRPNTFIAFAAKEGSTAADGVGEHSPFTMALLTHLTTPGLDIRKAFGFVRDDVMSSTGNRQEPYTTNSLGGNDVSLVAAPAAPPSPPRRPRPLSIPMRACAGTMRWPNASAPWKRGTPSSLRIPPASIPISPGRSATSSPPTPSAPWRPRRPASLPRSAPGLLPRERRRISRPAPPRRRKRPKPRGLRPRRKNAPRRQARRCRGCKAAGGAGNG